MPVAKRVLVGMVGVAVAAASAEAQVIGTFRWQTAPFCNVVTLTVTQQPGGVFTLDGFDDQCGASMRAAASGMGVPNPDGTIALGLTIVSAPEASPLHLTVPVDLATLGGTWRDSAGQSGPFRFTPGAGTGGARRPSTGTLGPIVLPTTPDGALDLSNPRGIVSRVPDRGTLLWLTDKGALRAGDVGGTQWDDARVGVGSVAFGLDTVASGRAAMAVGTESVASGERSFATGLGTIARGESSVAFGFSTQADGSGAAAFGLQTRARGRSAIAGGEGSLASGDGSLAIGSAAIAAGSGAVSLGISTAASGLGSAALGLSTAANGTASVALGSRAVANAPGSFVFGDHSIAATVESRLPNQFLVRAAGGTVFWSTAATAFPSSPGVTLFHGESAWSSLSDVHAKEHFSDLDGDAVLAKLVRMPIREWSFKAHAGAIRHVGPTAQDFHAAFGLGQDERRISTIDADGIALRAIQALEARTRTLMDENRALRDELAEIRQLLTVK